MKWWIKIKEAIVKSLSSEYTCDNCGREVFDYPSERLCASCNQKIVKNDGRVCEKCGRPMRALGLCLPCKREPPEFEKAASPLVYHGEAALLVNRFKQGDRYLFNYFSGEMAKVVDRLELPCEPTLIPVPVTPKKRTLRGFNQAEELAKGLSALTGYPVDKGILFKVRDGEQKKLSAKERKEFIRGAFRVKKRKACREKVFLLVDDILTTGATGSECARVLKLAGAKAVYLITACALPQRE